MSRVRADLRDGLDSGPDPQRFPLVYSRISLREMAGSVRMVLFRGLLLVR